MKHKMSPEECMMFSDVQKLCEDNLKGLCVRLKVLTELMVNFQSIAKQYDSERMEHDINEVNRACVDLMCEYKSYRSVLRNKWDKPKKWTKEDVEKIFPVLDEVKKKMQEDADAADQGLEQESDK